MQAATSAIDLQDHGVTATIKQHVVRVWCLLLALLLITSVATSQLYTGSVARTVTDPSGGVISAAKVTAVDAEKGFPFTGTTDSEGRYILRQLPPGRYNVQG